MQRSKNRSQSQLGLRRDFPLLKPVAFQNKQMINLAKLQINKNVTHMDYNNTSKQLKSSFSHKRILTGLGPRQTSYSQFSRTSRGGFMKTNDNTLQKSLKKQNTSQGEIKKNNNARNTQDNQRNKNFILSLAKTSIKSIGTVKGYAVNSHPGLLNTVNEDRVCIVTNLNKSTIKGGQISFFGVFDGKNGIAKAQFYRDHYHIQLIKDRDFYTDPQKALKRTIDYIEKYYYQSQIEFKEVNSRKWFSIVLIMNQYVYFLQTGEQKCFISSELGKIIMDPHQTIGHVQKILSRKNFRKPSNSKIKFRCIPIRNIDYIVLGSEGLYQNFTYKTLGCQIWKQLLINKADNHHLSLGLCVNSVLNDILTSQQSTKNISMIMIGLENLFDSLFKEDQIILPYVDEKQILDTINF